MPRAVRALHRLAGRAAHPTSCAPAAGFVSIGHPTAGVHIALLRTGLDSFKPREIAGLGR